MNENLKKAIELIEAKYPDRRIRSLDIFSSSPNNVSYKVVSPITFTDVRYGFVDMELKIVVEYDT